MKSKILAVVSWAGFVALQFFLPDPYMWEYGAAAGGISAIVTAIFLISKSRTKKESSNADYSVDKENSKITSSETRHIKTTRTKKSK